MEVNFLNDIDKGKAVYEYIPLHHLRDILRNKEFTLRRTCDWRKDGDVYENFLLQQFANNNTTEQFIYGQCWTLKKESDAMWRIYSGKPKDYMQSIDELRFVAVKVQTTINKLIDVFQSSSNPLYEKCAIGQVKYMSTNNINKWMDKNSNWTNETLMQSCFMKRFPFSHEKEFRIIVCGNHSGKMEIIKINIEPKLLFEKYVLDPRLSNIQCDFIKAQLTSMGVEKSKIIKSSLYTFKHHCL